MTLALMMGWEKPYIPRLEFKKGLLRLLTFVDYLGYTLKLKQETAKQYYSGAKQTQLKSMEYLMDDTLHEGPWYPVGSNHPLVALALSLLPVGATTEGFAIPIEWIEEGWYEWSRHQYVSISVIFGFVARKCEFLLSPTPEHQAKWGMVVFQKVDLIAGTCERMTRHEIMKTPCGMVSINLDSRKHQKKGRVRPQPGRLNTSHLEDPSTGLDEYRGGDVATELQAWFILSGACYRSEEELENLAVLADFYGELCSAESLIKLLRKKAVTKNVNPLTVKLHGLRIGPITRMVNSTTQLSESTQTAISGHKSIQSMTPYIRAGVGMAASATAVLRK
jgi:hypothetical protein